MVRSAGDHAANIPENALLQKSLVQRRRNFS
jgi:hypothetical protein